MISLPRPDPGTPDARSGPRFLLWLARTSARPLLLGSVFGVGWMVGQALVPAVIGRAIDAGVAHRDPAALLRWSSAVVLLGAVIAGCGVARHRFAVTNFLIAASRVQQLVARHVVHLGAEVSRHRTSGEWVAVGDADVTRIGRVVDVSARFVGAIVSFAVVSAVLLATSTVLGLVVVLGVPLVVATVTPLVRPLERRESVQRELLGTASGLAADTVAGLRVLRGLGGEEMFARRFAVASEEVRAAAVRTARLQATLEALQVLLPGAFVVAVTWLGARFALERRITVGELVAFYAYAAFLVVPIQTVIESATKYAAGVVGASRVAAVLRLQRELPEPAVAAGPASTGMSPTGPVPTGPLLDTSSGLRIEPGRLTAVACADPADGSALADRLGRYVEAEVSWGGTPLGLVPTAQLRERIVVVDQAAALLSGPLAETLAWGGGPVVPIRSALAAAEADEIVDSLPEGLSTEVTERGRSLSGGQRQRLTLARALSADREVLVLDEPTSAVDAQTEARIARGVRTLRAGRTTVVISTSPLHLEVADEVALLIDGRVVAAGTHRSLLATDAGYRSVVLRTGEE